ncbi:MAG TPA: class I SAM-dependent methyltransferase [Longimicrobium sp.]|nr:class I SAM-dependent methyltransferase [Longimicrobium sp.]
MADALPAADSTSTLAPPPAPDPAGEPRYRALLEQHREHWWDSENWDKWAGHYISEYPRGRFILETLRRYAPELTPAGARVLDVGCGDAGVLIAFAEAGARCAGMEPDARSLERGRVRAQEHGVEVDLRQGFAEQLPFGDAEFDLVVLDNVLEHVRDRERTLAEIRRVVRPGGLLYLVTPKPFALASLWSDPHYRMAGLVLMPRPMQVWYFERVRGGGRGNYGVGVIPTRRGVLRMLARHGFRSLVPPRALWIHYLREKIAAPAGLSSGLKRRLGRWVAERPWTTDSPPLRWAWDVAIGSNFFIARREG